MNPCQPPVVEPPGYVSRPGHVKIRPENNDHYVESYRNDPWYLTIRETHQRIAEMVPHYCIVKISTGPNHDRFDFYYSLPEALSAAELPDWTGGDVERLREEIDRIIGQARARCFGNSQAL